MGSACTETPHLDKSIDFIKSRIGQPDEIVIHGNGLTIPEVVSVSEDTTKRVRIDDSAHEEMKKNAEYLTEKIGEGLVVYGINTGFGGSADVRSWEIEEVQRSLIRHSKVGMATYFDNEVTRAGMLVRANSDSRAYSGIRNTVLQRMVDLINHDIVPRVPERGSVSASGDLNPLSYIGAAMCGQDDSWVVAQGKLMKSHEALTNAALEPVTLRFKEGLAIINSDSFSAGNAARCVYTANVNALLTQVCVAMAVEALQGRTETFDEKIQKRVPHVGQKEAASNIRRLIKGSRFARTSESNNVERQDRFALRSSPQWLSPILETLQDSMRRMKIEMNSSNDNPIIDHRTDTVLHGANFQGMTMSVAMDQTRQSMQLCGKLIFGLIQECINGKLNYDLPANVAGMDCNVDFGFKGVDIASAAYMSEMDHTANYTSTHVLCAETHNQSINSLALVSSRLTDKACHILRLQITNHLFVVCQTIELRWLQIRMKTVLNNIINQFPETEDALEDIPWWDCIYHAKSTAEEVAAVLPDSQKEKFSKQLLEKTSELYEKVSNDYQTIAEDLGQGTKKMYLFIRDELKVPFNRGQRALDADLETIFASIKSRRIEEVLVSIFQD
ncbi:unnamed protein product [Owenia fusiformis]|uniref:Uncharacterized protein n=1 Tax=Owenia fusiformis TaxID=6347 RepID=A0A8J1TWF1_OWEFU|nr:unnamed protein product [Owenia fusiformis]